MASPNLHDLYREIILAHHRRPRNQGELTNPDASVHVKNPTCGDEITLQIRLRDGCIGEIRSAGRGCVISQASASMMTEMVQGKTLLEVDGLARRFTEMLQGSAQARTDRSLGELRAFSGVAKFPTRVRCALLAWTALDGARNGLDRG